VREAGPLVGAAQLQVAARRFAVTLATNATRGTNQQREREQCERPAQNRRPGTATTAGPAIVIARELLRRAMEEIHLLLEIVIENPFIPTMLETVKHKP